MFALEEMEAINGTYSDVNSRYAQEWKDFYENDISYSGFWAEQMTAPAPFWSYSWWRAPLLRRWNYEALTIAGHRFAQIDC